MMILPTKWHWLAAAIGVPFVFWMLMTWHPQTAHPATPSPQIRIAGSWYSLEQANASLLEWANKDEERIWGATDTLLAWAKRQPLYMASRATSEEELSFHRSSIPAEVAYSNLLAQALNPREAKDNTMVLVVLITAQHSLRDGWQMHLFFVEADRRSVQSTAGFRPL